MKTSYDKEANAIYIQFDELSMNEHAVSHAEHPDIILDFKNSDPGHLFGVEILDDSLFDIDQLKTLQYEEIQ